MEEKKEGVIKGRRDGFPLSCFPSVSIKSEFMDQWIFVPVRGLRPGVGTGVIRRTLVVTVKLYSSCLRYDGSSPPEPETGEPGGRQCTGGGFTRHPSSVSSSFLFVFWGPVDDREEGVQDLKPGSWGFINDRERP